MNKPHATTPGQRAQIIELLTRQPQVPIKEIARRMGVSRPTIRHIRTCLNDGKYSGTITTKPEAG